MSQTLEMCSALVLVPAGLVEVAVFLLYFNIVEVVGVILVEVCV